MSARDLACQAEVASSPWITKEEAAARARVSPKTIQRAWADGSLRKGPRLPLTRREWVDEWIEGRQEPPAT